MKKYGDIGVNKYKEMKDGRVTKGLRTIRREGFLIFYKRFFHYCLRKTWSNLTPLIIFLTPQKYFYYLHQKIPYFRHKKSLTWTNERAIEIPVAMNLIKEYNGKNILEVGAVLPHYFPYVKKDTLDKFEKGNNIINEDIIKYKPKDKYDLIISISTLEHVGFDDDIKDSEGIIKALNNIKNNCLNKKGKLVVTLPIGYNKFVDQLLFEHKLCFDKIITYRRKKGNIWREVPLNSVKLCKYKKQAEAIVFCIFENN